MASAIALPVKQGLSSKDEKFLILLGGGIVLGTAGFFVGRSIYRKNKQKKTERKATDEDSPASYAVKLMMAFENDGWWGTDEDKVFEVLAAIPDGKTYTKVAAAYENLKKHKSTLDGDLKDELTSDEYQKALNIINSKPDKVGEQGQYKLLANWTNRLITASDGWGTDEDAIFQVLREVPDKTGLDLLKKKYLETKRVTLDAMLKDELGDDDYAKANEIMDSKT